MEEFCLTRHKDKTVFCFIDPQRTEKRGGDRRTKVENYQVYSLSFVAQHKLPTPQFSGRIKREKKSQFIIKLFLAHFKPKKQ